jgi:hypothetical protein
MPFGKPAAPLLEKSLPGRGGSRFYCGFGEGESLRAIPHAYPLDQEVVVATGVRVGLPPATYRFKSGSAIG